MRKIAFGFLATMIALIAVVGFGSGSPTANDRQDTKEIAIKVCESRVLMVKSEINKINANLDYAKEQYDIALHLSSKNAASKDEQRLWKRNYGVLQREKEIATHRLREVEALLEWAKLKGEIKDPVSR